MSSSSCSTEEYSAEDHFYVSYCTGRCLVPYSAVFLLRCLPGTPVPWQVLAAHNVYLDWQSHDWCVIPHPEDPAGPAGLCLMRFASLATPNSSAEQLRTRWLAKLEQLGNSTRYYVGWTDAKGQAKLDSLTDVLLDQPKAEIAYFEQPDGLPVQVRALKPTVQ